MENELKRAVESIDLPEDAAARIERALELAPEKLRRRLRGRAVLAAVAAAALLVVGAGAASVGYFANRNVVPSGARFGEAEFINSGVVGEDDAPEGYSVEHAGGEWTGCSVEEQYSAAPWNKFRSWDSDEYIAGSTRAGVYEWTEFEVIQGEGDLLIRDVFDVASGAVKREYMAFDPAEFAPYTDEFFKIDYDAIEEGYDALDAPWLFYTISDRQGAVKGVSYRACYAASNGASFTLDYFGDYWVKNLSVIQEFILADEYDSVYTYTSSTGAQFLILVKDDVIVAECCFVADEGRNYSSDVRFRLNANFMTADEVEAVLDCVNLNLQ